MGREEIIAKADAGTLTVADLCDPDLLAIAKGVLRKKRPDLDWDSDPVEKLLQDIDIIAAIDERVDVKTAIDELLATATNHGVGCGCWSCQSQ